MFHRLFWWSCILGWVGGGAGAFGFARGFLSVFQFHACSTFWFLVPFLFVLE